MAKMVFLLGGGGHGRVALEALLASGITVGGVLDSELNTGDQIFGVPVLGGDEYLEQIDPADVALVNGVGANPSTLKRKKLFEAMKAKGFVFDGVVHASAVIARECDLGEGSQVMAGAVLQNRVRVDANAVVNTRASIDHDCVVAAHAFVSPGAVLCGMVTVAELAFVGANAVLLPGIHVGASAVVAAGAVVTSAVPAGQTVAGNPAAGIGTF